MADLRTFLMVENDDTNHCGFVCLVIVNALSLGAVMLFYLSSSEFYTYNTLSSIYAIVCLLNAILIILSVCMNTTSVVWKRGSLSAVLSYRWLSSSFLLNFGGLGLAVTYLIFHLMIAIASNDRYWTFCVMDCCVILIMLFPIKKPVTAEQADLLFLTGIEFVEEEMGEHVIKSYHCFSGKIIKVSHGVSTIVAAAFGIAGVWYIHNNNDWVNVLCTVIIALDLISFLCVFTSAYKTVAESMLMFMLLVVVYQTTVEGLSIYHLEREHK